MEHAPELDTVRTAGEGLGTQSLTVRFRTLRLPTLPWDPKRHPYEALPSPRPSSRTNMKSTCVDWWSAYLMLVVTREPPSVNRFLIL
jgi:hypothetical protein